MRVSARPMAIGAKPTGTLPCVDPRMMIRKNAVRITSISNADRSECPRRMLPIAIGSKTTNVSPRLAGDDHVKSRRGNDRPKTCATI